MICLLVALSVLQQETAEEVFNRLEQSVQAAKSLRIKYRLDLELGGQTTTATGTVLLKQGNMAKITLAGIKGNPWTVSDGKKVRVDANQGIVDGAVWDAPQDLNSRVSTALIRRGVLDLPDYPRRLRIPNSDPKEKLKVSGLKLGEIDGGSHTLSYILQEGTGKAEIKLWYDPKDLTVKKRTLCIAANPKATVTETYEEFRLNGEIPDESFKP